MITVGSDFSGVGAFNQALNRLGIDYKEVFACDWDKYARQTYIENYGEPDLFPKDVYDREIPKDPLTIYMTSPPCQSFSIAGKRLGKEDERGILFFNSYEFIKKNKPRYFIFENVKGLLSDDNGKTFQEWVNMLGGKSVNYAPVIFPYEESVPYHLYWKVLNAKDFDIPQNRERVFLIGIRDDVDNNFRFPIEEYSTKTLKDIIEDEFDEKYYLSEKIVQGFLNKNNPKFVADFKPKDEDEISSCITARYYKQAITDPYLKVKNKAIIVGNTNPSNRGMNGEVYHEEGISPTLWSGHGEGLKIMIKEKNKILIGDFRYDEGIRWRKDEKAPTLRARANEDASSQPITSDGYKIRRLTPRECFRLMDFPDSFTWTCSDSQAYKQAGNSICVGVLYRILKRLNL